MGIAFGIFISLSSVWVDFGFIFFAFILSLFGTKRSNNQPKWPVVAKVIY